MKRPTGVTLLVRLNFLVAGFCALGAALYWDWSPYRPLYELPLVAPDFFIPVPTALFFWMTFKVPPDLAFLLSGGTAVAVGIGLWKLNNTVRWIAIVMSYANLIFSAGISFSLLHRPLSSFFALIQAAIYAGIVWYLLNPDLKEAFGVMPRVVSKKGEMFATLDRRPQRRLLPFLLAILGGLIAVYILMVLSWFRIFSRFRI